MEHDPGGLFDQIGDDGYPAQRCAVVPHDKTLLAAGAVAVFAASVRLELGEVVIDAGLRVPSVTGHLGHCCWLGSFL